MCIWTYHTHASSSVGIAVRRARLPQYHPRYTLKTFGNSSSGGSSSTSISDNAPPLSVRILSHQAACCRAYSKSTSNITMSVAGCTSLPLTRQNNVLPVGILCVTKNTCYPSPEAISAPLNAQPTTRTDFPENGSGSRYAPLCVAHPASTASVIPLTCSGGGK